MEIVNLKTCPERANEAASWFHSKWGIPLEAYKKSIADSLSTTAPVPQWYLALENDRIVGGCGVIENDFHNRPELSPNVCAVYVEKDCRNRGIAGQLLNFTCLDMRQRGVSPLYLLTDHDSFYERYGWEYLCPVTGDGETKPSRMYIHR